MGYAKVIEICQKLLIIFQLLSILYYDQIIVLFAFHLA